MFKTDPFVKKAHVSAAMMPLFLTGLFKTMEWVHHIVDAAIPDPTLDMDLKSSASEDEEGYNRSHHFFIILALDPFGSASIKFKHLALEEELLDNTFGRTRPGTNKLP